MSNLFNSTNSSISKFSRVYFYLQKLKDRSNISVNKTDYISSKNLNKNYPIFRKDFPALLLLPESSFGKKLLLTENKQNKENKVKMCSDCKFYIDKDDYKPNGFYIYDGIGTCTYKHGLFGIKQGIFSSVIRLDDTMCGKEGKWFQKKG